MSDISDPLSVRTYPSIHKEHYTHVSSHPPLSVQCFYISSPCVVAVVLDTPFNEVIVIPPPLKVETVSSGLSLNLSHPLPLWAPFRSSLLLLHSISITPVIFLF